MSTEHPTNPLFSSNGVKKRSRSPSDEGAEPPKNPKRPNTGTSITGDDAPRNVLGDANMLDDNNDNGAGDDMTMLPTADDKEHSEPKTVDEHTSAGPGVVNSNASSPTVNQPAQASINSSGNISGDSSSTSRPTSPSTSAPASHSTASAQIHMRCLIVTQDASIIIGKKGTHVNEIREKSGARVVVSESIPGNPERILNVSGPLDAVSKAFGLIVRRINDEPFDAPSVPGSRAVTIKFMIPNSRMGSVIGKQGTKIKEIQDASGARLNASEGMLPGSTERVLSVAGVADAIHIATYYIGNILIEANERMPSTINSSYRPQNRTTRPPSNMQATYPYSTPYTYPPQPPPPPPPPPPHHHHHHHHHGVHHPPAPHAHSHVSHPHPHAHPHAASQPLQTQQIYIPNDLVGCIIGKGGSKINEIRQMSASQIKIMEPGAVGVGMNAHPGSENERLVVITGQPANIQMAVSLLYQRLEQEKQKQMMQANNTSGSSSGGLMRLDLFGPGGPRADGCYTSVKKKKLKLNQMPFPPTTKDFTVLPIIYKSPPPFKNTQHILYLREHILRPLKSKAGNETRETYPNGRTLFVVNTPPDSTERELRLFFQSCGHVERVVLQRGGEDELVTLAEESGDSEDDDEGDDEDEGNNQDPHGANTKRSKRKNQKAPQVIALPLHSSEMPLRIYGTTGSTAYIIFADPGAISTALQLREAPESRRTWPFGIEPSSGIAVAPSGLAHYVALHDAERPPLDAVKKHADSYVQVYEYNKTMSSRKNKSKYKKGEAIVDEDGFTLVVRGGAYGQSVGGGVGVASKMFVKELEDEATSNPKKKKKKKHEKEDFYKFQIHEKKRQGECKTLALVCEVIDLTNDQDLIALKANFEKDKEKLISAKRARYRPY